MKKLILLFSVFVGMFFPACSYQASNQMQDKEETGIDSLKNIEEGKNKPSLSAKELKSFFIEQRINSTVIVQPRNLNPNGDGVYCYFRLKNGKATSLRLRIQYWEEKYADADQYIFDIDGEKYTYSANKSKTGTENSRIVSNAHFSWYDNGMNQTDLAFLQKLMEAGTVKISLMDRAINKSLGTIVLTSGEKKNIERTLDYYFALDGAKIPKQGMVNIRQ